MFVPQGLSRNEEAKARRDYLEYLNISSKLQQDYEASVNELARNRAIGVTALPPKYTDSATELKDAVYQREIAFGKLKTMMKPADASVALTGLMNSDEVVLFNRFFAGFERAVGYQQSITPDLFEDLWNTYKVKLAKTGDTGIEIGVTKDDVDASLEDLQNEIEALTGRLEDNQQINAKEMQSILKKSDELVNSEDFNALTNLLNELAVLETGVEKEAAIKKASEEKEERERVKREVAQAKKDVEDAEQKRREGVEKDMKSDVDNILSGYPMSKLKESIQDLFDRGETASFVNSSGAKKKISFQSRGASMIEYLLYKIYKERPIPVKYTAVPEPKVEKPKKKKSVKTFKPPSAEELAKMAKESAEEYAKELAEERRAKEEAKGEGVRRRGGRVPINADPFDEWVNYTQSIKKKKIKGRGIQTMSNFLKLDNEHKEPNFMKQSPRFMDLGFYKIHIPSLHKGFLSIRYKRNGRSVKPRVLISDGLKRVFFQLLSGEDADSETLKKLDKGEIILLDNILSFCQVDVSLQNKLHKNLKIVNSVRDKDIARFNLLRGELLAGNDNKDIIKELKTLILKMAGNSYITQTECNKILYEISTLS